MLHAAWRVILTVWRLRSSASMLLSVRPTAAELLHVHCRPWLAYWPKLVCQAARLQGGRFSWQSLQPSTAPPIQPGTRPYTWLLQMVDRLTCRQAFHHDDACDIAPCLPEPGSPCKPECLGKPPVLDVILPHWLTFSFPLQPLPHPTCIHLLRRYI